MNNKIQYQAAYSAVGPQRTKAEQPQSNLSPSSKVLLLHYILFYIIGNRIQRFVASIINRHVGIPLVALMRFHSISRLSDRRNVYRTVIYTVRLRIIIYTTSIRRVKILCVKCRRLITLSFHRHLLFTIII